MSGNRVSSGIIAVSETVSIPALVVLTVLRRKTITNNLKWYSVLKLKGKLCVWCMFLHRALNNVVLKSTFDNWYLSSEGWIGPFQVKKWREEHFAQMDQHGQRL